jgi:hypothetical protein
MSPRRPFDPGRGLRQQDAAEHNRVTTEAADCTGIVDDFPTDLADTELGGKSLAFDAGFRLCPM